MYLQVVRFQDMIATASPVGRNSKSAFGLPLIVSFQIVSLFYSSISYVN